MYTGHWWVLYVYHVNCCAPPPFKSVDHFLWGWAFLIVEP